LLLRQRPTTNNPIGRTALCTEAMASTSSSSSPDEVDGLSESRARMKEMARDSRFNFRNLAEHQLRRELKEEAIEICNPQLKEFAECSQEKGLMVVFSCQSFFQKVNECLNEHNGVEAWEKYKAKHADEIERRARVG
jgi:N-acetylglucosamine kinase-like BadF-type ATPase